MDSHFIEAVCLAAIEILGEKDAFLILKKTGVRSFTSFDSSLFSLEKMGAELARKFDLQISMGLMIRIGRASLTFLRRFFPEISDLGRIENRLNPIDKRFSESLSVLAKTSSDELGTNIKLECSEKLSYEWHIDAKRQSFAFYYYFGLLEEFCHWMDARKDYHIVYTPGENPADSESISITVREKE